MSIPKVEIRKSFDISGVCFKVYVNDKYEYYCSNEPDAVKKYHEILANINDPRFGKEEIFMSSENLKA